MNCENKLFKLCYDLLDKNDTIWMKRKRCFRLRRVNGRTFFYKYRNKYAPPSLPLADRRALMLV